MPAIRCLEARIRPAGETRFHAVPPDAASRCRTRHVNFLGAEPLTALGGCQEAGSLPIRYWANEVDNTIRGGPLAGGSVANPLYDARSGVNDPGSVAIDPAGGHIYWTNPGDNTIRRGKLAGGFPPDTLYGSGHGVNGPFDLAIDVAGGRINR